MRNHNVINVNPQLLKGTIYGTDITKPIEVDNQGIIVTGTLLVDSTPSLSINMVESVDVPIQNTVSISIMDTSDVYVVKTGVHSITTGFTYPISATQISSNIISVSSYDKTTTYVYNLSETNDGLIASLYLTNTQDKADGVLYGEPKALVDQLYLKDVAFLCTQIASNLFVVVEGTATQDSPIEIYVLGINS